MIKLVPQVEELQAGRDPYYDDDDYLYDQISDLLDPFDDWFYSGNDEELQAETNRWLNSF